MEFKVKRCFKCKESLIASSDNFYKRSDGRGGGLQGYCKSCERIRRKSYDKDPDIRKRITKYHRDYYHNNKARVDAHNKAMQEQNPNIKIKKDLVTKKWNAELGDGAVKARIKRDIKRNENVIIDHADISPEFVELQRKRILLKRNLKTVNAE
jgi:hypothetical protein